jgi:UDP-glucose 4-epimerase
MNNVLVTGGCGFIGGHLVDKLVETYPSAKIVVVDDLRTPGKHINESDNVSYCFDSIQDPELKYGLMSKYSFDTIFHLANTPRVRRAIEFPAETIDNNVTSTTAVCDIGLQHSSKIYFAQSSSVQYNDQGTGTNAYTISKMFCDTILSMYRDQYGLDVTNMYYYSVYGPREADYGPYSTVVRRFKQRIENGDPMEIFGNGSKERDFTYVGDVVNNMMQMLDEPDQQELHFGAGKPVSILRLAETFSEYSNNHPYVFKFDIEGEAQITRSKQPYGEYEGDVLEYIKQWSQSV